MTGKAREEIIQLKIGSCAWYRAAQSRKQESICIVPKTWTWESSTPKK